MEKPLIQIDDTIREMTDDEHASYLEQITPLPVEPTE
jgi:hypothetical protein